MNFELKDLEHYAFPVGHLHPEEGAGMVILGKRLNRPRRSASHRVKVLKKQEPGTAHECPLCNVEEGMKP